MADSNSLILLPPRHTAQSPQNSSSTTPVKPSKDGSFGKKLEKAKSAVVKKPVVDAAVKPKAVVAPAKTAVKAATPGTPAADKTVKDPKKAVAAAEDPQAEKNQEEDHPPETVPTQVVGAEEQAHVAAEKKPVKVQKAVAGKTTAQNPVTGAVVLKNPTAAPASKADATDDADPKGAVAAVDGDEDQSSGSDDAAGDSDALGNGEFGTGKIVAAGEAGGKNSAAIKAAGAVDSTQDPSASVAAIIAPVDVDTVADTESSAAKSVVKLDAHTGSVSSDGTELASLSSGTAAPVAGKASVAAAATPQAQFVEENHPKIITAIQGQLLPHGGTVQIRLDPPELGALQVTMHLKDGVMSASFETSNDDATKLLSHSLGQLKSSLEAAGISVDKIHVEQAPKRDSQNDSESDSKQSTQDKQGQAQQDQQRREMVQRMWRKLAGGGDPLDLVA
jgi:flagellar hook-length control protein FliK